MDNTNPETFFDILGLPFNATNPGLIENAYHKQKLLHQGDPNRLKAIETAYATVANPPRRDSYVKLLISSGRGPQTPPPAPAAETPRPAGSPPRQEPQRGKYRGGTEIITGSFTPSQPAPQPGPAAPDTGARSGRTKTDVFQTGAAGQPPARPQEPPPAERAPRSATEPLEETRHRRMGQSPASTTAQPPVPPAAKETPAPSSGHKRSKTDIVGPTVPDSRPPAKSGRAPTASTGGQASAKQDVKPGEPPAEPAAVQAAEAKAVLTCKIEVQYQGEPAFHTLKRGENRVGRPAAGSPTPEVPLPDERRFISRTHAVIRVDESGCCIRDQGSDNGTLLNGERLDPCCFKPLSSGDKIVIEGRTLVVHIDAA